MCSLSLYQGTHTKSLKQNRKISTFLHQRRTIWVSRRMIIVIFRDPGLDLRVEHSHGWGGNSQVRSLTTWKFFWVKIYFLIHLLIGRTLPLWHNPWGRWILGILQHCRGSIFPFPKWICLIILLFSALLSCWPAQGDAQSWPVCARRERIVFLSSLSMLDFCCFCHPIFLSDWSLIFFSKVTHMVGRD